MKLLGAVWELALGCRAQKGSRGPSTAGAGSIGLWGEQCPKLPLQHLASHLSPAPLKARQPPHFHGRQWNVSALANSPGFSSWCRGAQAAWGHSTEETLCYKAELEALRPLNTSRCCTSHLQLRALRRIWLVNARHVNDFHNTNG